MTLCLVTEPSHQLPGACRTCAATARDHISGINSINCKQFRQSIVICADRCFAGMYQPPSGAGIRAPLLDGQADDNAEAAGPGSLTSSGGVSGSGRGPQLWAPLEYEAMPRWRWVDWCRYLFYRSALCRRNRIQHKTAALCS